MVTLKWRSVWLYVTCLQLPAHSCTQVIECSVVKCAIWSTPVTFREDGVTARWAWFKYGGIRSWGKDPMCLLFSEESKLQQTQQWHSVKNLMLKCDKINKQDSGLVGWLVGDVFVFYFWQIKTKLLCFHRKLPGNSRSCLTQPVGRGRLTTKLTCNTVCTVEDDRWMLNSSWRIYLGVNKSGDFYFGSPVRTFREPRLQAGGHE